jgi:hypothetical protein
MRHPMLQITFYPRHLAASRDRVAFLTMALLVYPVPVLSIYSYGEAAETRPGRNEGRRQTYKPLQEGAMRRMHLPRRRPTSEEGTNGTICRGNVCEHPSHIAIGAGQDNWGCSGLGGQHATMMYHNCFRNGGRIRMFKRFHSK